MKNQKGNHYSSEMMNYISVSLKRC